MYDIHVLWFECLDVIFITLYYYVWSNLVEIWLSGLFFACTLFDGGYKTNIISIRVKSDQD
jgi:hypothetical protein